jgi:hypothetical protein
VITPLLLLLSLPREKESRENRDEKEREGKERERGEFRKRSGAR